MKPDMKGYLASNIDLAIRRTLQGLKRLEYSDDEVVKTVLGTVKAINNIPELKEMNEFRSVFTEEDVRRYCEAFQSQHEAFLESDQCMMCTGCRNTGHNH